MLVLKLDLYRTDAYQAPHELPAAVLISVALGVSSLPISSNHLTTPVTHLLGVNLVHVSSAVTTSETMKDVEASQRLDLAIHEFVCCVRATPLDLNEISL